MKKKYNNNNNNIRLLEPFDGIEQFQFFLVEYLYHAL